MRVLYFIEEGKLGGPQVQMVRVAEGIRACDAAQVRLLIPRANSAAFQSLCQRHSVPFQTAPITRLTKEAKPLFGYVVLSPVEVWRLASLLRHCETDLIHAWGGSWQWKGVLLSLITRTPVVWLLNDTKMPRYILAIFKRIARWSDGFIFASHRTEEYYTSLVPPTAPRTVIQSMVDDKEFDPSRPYKGDEKLISSFGDDLVIGMVANINPVKGIETFIRVAAHARKLETRCRFVVIGEVFKRQQRYMRKLTNMAYSLGAENITFVGARNDVRPLLKRFDIYLCSSLAESSPVAVWEAMMMAKPIISTDVGDVPRFVHHGEAGYVTDVGDDEALFRHVLDLVDEPKRREMGEAARRIATANFRRDVIVTQTETFYRRILEEKSRLQDREI